MFRVESKDAKGSQTARALRTPGAHQSIKFQIEVPMNMSMGYDAASCTDTEDYEPMVTNFNRNKLERRSMQQRHHEYDYESSQPTICLKISFDRMNTQRKSSRTSSVATGSSGYSSSMSNASSLQCLNEPVETTEHKTRSSLYCDENIYDKLSYNTSKRRYSVSSSSSSSAQSCMSTPAESVDDIYEEITNFTQMHFGNKPHVHSQSLAALPPTSTRCPPKLEHVYCNETVKPVRSAFKRREYTINEIFQNAKSFREEANKQEIKLIPNGPLKSVNMLKQLFETNPAPKKSLNQTQLSTERLNKQPIGTRINTSHVYVNEKISAAVNV